MKKVVTFGEIMLRLTPPGLRRFSQASSFDVVYGGGESNVAVSLANYGIPVDFVSRIPANDIGDCAVMELRKRGVGTQQILRQGDRLGIYFLEIGAVSRGSKVVYDRAHSSMSTIEAGMIDWEAALEGADWFHWTGITPALSQGAADACLEAVQMANKLGVTVSTDLNYRKKLWKYGKTPGEIMPALVECCDVILGNEEDAEKHFGLHPEGVDVTQGGSVSGEAYLSVLKQLMSRFPRAQKVITTLRGSISASHNTWSGVLYDGTNLYEAPEYNITHIVDRVGGGDSFMAGLIYGLLSYPGDDQTALNFAVAASCLKHTIYGDANLSTIEEVEKLMKGDASGRVSR
ncbi:MAG: sugar kinase [Saprospiraceae bacterium]|nr:sugar kinase [Saprospiraceae bacterium]